MAEETAGMKLARESAEKRGSKLVPSEGRAVITCGASELIATRAYSNVVVGPVTVSRVVNDDETLAAEIQRTQQLCEAAVAEERKTLHALVRGSTDNK